MSECPQRHYGLSAERDWNYLCAVMFESKDGGRTFALLLFLKLITCSEGKICYTNYSWHYPGYLEEYSFIRNLLDFRCVSTDSALRIICNYILVDFLGYFQAI